MVTKKFLGKKLMQYIFNKTIFQIMVYWPLESLVKTQSYVVEANTFHAYVFCFLLCDWWKMPEKFSITLSTFSSSYSSTTAKLSFYREPKQHPCFLRGLLLKKTGCSVLRQYPGGPNMPKVTLSKWWKIARWAGAGGEGIEDHFF